MRVALVHMRHSGTGGTERYLNQLSAHLARGGHEPIVICRSHEDPSHPAVRFEVLRPPAVGAGMRAWSFARAVEKHLARTKYDVVYGLGRTWSQDLLRLGGGCHATWLEEGYGAGGSALARGLGLLRWRHRVALAIERRALAPGAFRRLVTNSRMVQEDVVERYGIAREDTEVIYNGADLERFHPPRDPAERTALRHELDLADAEPLVLFLGTGYQRKGLDLTLEAFAQLLGECPTARLLVVGYDSRAATYRRRAERLGIADKVRFAGGRRDPERYYRAADLYVLPTRYDPFANSTLEALASGLPVLTSDLNGGGELIEQDVQGSVIALHSGSAGLARALISWAGRTDRPEASRAARQLAEQHPVQAKLQRAQELLEQLAETRST